MKAVKNFKRIADPSRTGSTMQSILGDEYEAHFVEPPMEMDSSEEFPEVGFDADTHSSNGFGGGIKKVLARHPLLGLHTRVESSGELSGNSQSTGVSSRPEHSPSSSRWHSGLYEERKDSGSIRSSRSDADGSHEPRPGSSASPHPAFSPASSATIKRSLEGTRGHARDPLEEEFPYLYIGPSTYTGTSPQEPSEFNIGSDPAPLVSQPEHTGDMDPAMSVAESEEPKQIVSESPGAADFDIYETAYRQELDRIESNLTYPEPNPKVYLTRRVEGKDAVMKFVKDKALDLQIGQRKFFAPSAQKGPSAFSAAVSVLRNQMDHTRETGTEKAETQEQRQDLQETSTQESHPQERRGSHPPSSSLSSQSIPGPEASSLEATGVSADAHPDEEGSTARLQRLLGRVHKHKSGTGTE